MVDVVVMDNWDFSNLHMICNKLHQNQMGGNGGCGGDGQPGFFKSSFDL